MSKRQNDLISLKELMGGVLKEGKLYEGIKKISIKESWASVMGSGIVSYTEKVEIKGGTLFVKLKSSVLKEELSYGKDKIKDMMNNAMGTTEIKKVSFF